LKGLIFNIQKFSIHDGPGIRTTVFMKGCPLRCLWCSNPESQSSTVELMTRDVKCIKCGVCEEVCPIDAITITQQGSRLINIDRSKCNLCLKCVDACPAKAIEVIGKYMSVEEVMDEVAKDEQFYLNSGGGVTLSGGEPLFQGEFAYELLKACKERGFHTALDTSGYCDWKILGRILDHTDLVLYDIKHLDEERHKWGTGKNSQLILENLSKVAGKGKKIWLRIPVIAGYNDFSDDIIKVINLGLEVGAEKISLLPYHEWGKSKYANLGMPYCAEGYRAPDDGHIRELKALVESRGMEAGIGN